MASNLLASKYLGLLLNESFVRFSIHVQRVLIRESSHRLNFDGAIRLALPDLKGLVAHQFEHPILSVDLLPVNPAKDPNL